MKFTHAVVGVYGQLIKVVLGVLLALVAIRVILLFTAAKSRMKRKMVA
jgi:hypothetical protein